MDDKPVIIIMIIVVKMHGKKLSTVLFLVCFWLHTQMPTTNNANNIIITTTQGLNVICKLMKTIVLFTIC